MKTKTIELYTFDELPDDIKAKVLDRMRYINVEDGWWYDYDGKTGFTAKELKRMKVKPSDAPDELIRWNHLYFDIDRAWYIQFVGDVQFVDDEIARKFLRVPKRLWNKVTWNFVNNNYGGNSHGTTKLEWEYFCYENDKDLTLDQAEILDRACELFADKMEEALRGLQSAYEYSTSDESIIETIKANEYTFRADGTMESA